MNDFEFDPTAGASLQQELRNCSIGKSPTGFPKIHVEMLPGDLMKMIGYDPRTIPAEPRQNQHEPANVSRAIIELVRQVQRSIDPQKVQEMVQYLCNALSNAMYADWTELDVVTASKPDLTRWEASHSIYFPNSAEYFITDGQHRFCALMDFVRQYPDYANKFTQAVSISVLPQDRLDEWAGQSFHDKNYLRTIVKATKALAVDSRDLHNVLAKELGEHKVVKEGGGVNEVKDALSVSAKEFTTHSALYRLTRGFCEGRRGLEKGAVKNSNLTKESYMDYKKLLFEYVSELNRVFPHWTMFPERENYLFRSSPALQALGVIGHDLYTKVQDSTQRKTMIARIGEAKLDWLRTNIQDWGTIIGSIVEKGNSDGQKTKEISPRSNRQAFDATIRFLRTRCGLTEYLEQAGEDADAAEEIGAEAVQ